MAETHTQPDPGGADGALDRLEAALETIARGMKAPGVSPASMPSPSLALPNLAAIEARIDAAIAHITAALDRAPDQ